MTSVTPSDPLANEEESDAVAKHDPCGLILGSFLARLRFLSRGEQDQHSPYTSRQPPPSNTLTVNSDNPLA